MAEKPRTLEPVFRLVGVGYGLCATNWTRDRVFLAPIRASVGSPSLPVAFRANGVAAIETKRRLSL